MASSIGDLQVDLRLASAKFEQGLKDVNTKLAGFESGIASVKSAVGGLAGALAVGAFSAWIKTSIDAADAAAKTAQSLGITTEALTGLQFAAELSGVNNEKLSDAFKDLNKNIFDASQGAKSQADAFKSLGVSVTDSNGNLRSADSVLLDIADRFAESADGADKTAIAMRVFGESGRTLIPLLNSGSDGIEQLTARAEELGLVIDSNTAKSAERFNDNLTVFQATTRGLSNAIATAMLPTLENLSGELVRIGDEANFATEAASFFSNALKVLVTGGVAVKSVFETVGDVIGGTAAAIVQAAQGNFSESLAILNDDSAGQGIEEALARISRIWDDSANAALISGKIQQAELKRISDSSSGVPAEMSKEAEKAAQAIQKVIDGLTLEAQTVGMTKDQVALFKLELQGATDAQLAEARAAQAAIQSYDDRVRALDDALKAEEAYNAKKASAQSGLDSVSGGLQTVQERADAEYQARLEAINNGRALGLETTISYDELEIRAAMDREAQLTAIEQNATQARMALAEQERQAKIGAMQTLFGGLSTLMNTGSKKLFEVGKKAAIAKAVVDGYSAIQTTLASVPFPFNVAAAAGIAVQTASNIASIRAQQFGGGGTVSAAGGAPNVYRPAQPTVPNTSAGAQGSATQPGQREKITIINQTTGKITSARETQISPTERAILLEEAEDRVAASVLNPNSRMSRNLAQSTTTGRVR